MLGVLIALVAAALSFFKTRAALQLENLALRHQLGVLHLFGEEAEVDRGRDRHTRYASRLAPEAGWGRTSSPLKYGRGGG